MRLSGGRGRVGLGQGVWADITGGRTRSRKRLCLTRFSRVKGFASRDLDLGLYMGMTTFYAKPRDRRFLRGDAEEPAGGDRQADRNGEGGLER